MSSNVIKKKQLADDDDIIIETLTLYFTVEYTFTFQKCGLSILVTLFLLGVDLKLNY